jgi:DNA-binding CsgD family transcriptional regulator/PAS domain-containing protein
MSEDEKLSNLIAAIYDAALDSGLWPDVLAAIAEFVDGRVGGLLTKDSTSKHVNASWHSGGDPHYMQLYATTYSRLGPVAMSPPGEVEGIVSIPELVPYDEFRRGRFYREWARPQGWVDVAVAVLDRSASRSAYLSMSRDTSTGMVDATMRERLALLVPHVRRALLIGRAIEFKQAETATFADVLDGLSVGVFLIDANGRVVHANAAGNEMLGAGGFFRANGGRLIAGAVQFEQTLRDGVSAAADGNDEAEAGSIAIPLVAHDGERHVAHLLPLGSGARRRAGAVYDAAAALFVRRAELQSPPAPDVIAKTYNLTPAELRVLLGIVEIGGVPEVAVALGIAETTVKTHLGRVYAKTGTGRQADLVKLVAAFAMPLASCPRPMSPRLRVAS